MSATTDRDLLVQAEKALSHALAMGLGRALRPKMHQGVPDPADVEAVETLRALRDRIAKP